MCLLLCSILQGSSKAAKKATKKAAKIKAQATEGPSSPKDEKPGHGRKGSQRSVGISYFFQTPNAYYTFLNFISDGVSSIDFEQMCRYGGELFELLLSHGPSVTKEICELLGIFRYCCTALLFVCLFV